MPGATMQPPASISLAPPAGIRPLILATLSFLMARSALYRRMPVPSTMVPPRITRSYSFMLAHPFTEFCDRPAHPLESCAAHSFSRTIIIPSRPLHQSFRAFFPLGPIYEKEKQVIAGKTAGMLH